MYVRNNKPEVYSFPSSPFSLSLHLPPQTSKMQTTMGVLDPPLGNVRLQVVKLLSALLGRNSPSVAREVVVLDMFNTVIVSTHDHSQ